MPRSKSSKAPQAAQKLQQQALDSLIYLLINTGRQAKKVLKQDLERQAQNQQIPVELLSQLDIKGNTLIQLAARLRCSKQEASRLVQQAQNNGWVTLEPDLEDKRAKRVLFSKAGQDLLAQGYHQYQALENSVLAEAKGINAEDLKTTLRTLNRLLRQRQTD